MYWLSKETGIRYATIFNLCKDQDVSRLRLTVDVIDRICNALHCQPGDFIIHTVDSKRTTKKKHK